MEDLIHLFSAISAAMPEANAASISAKLYAQGLGCGKIIKYLSNKHWGKVNVCKRKIQYVIYQYTSVIEQNNANNFKYFSTETIMCSLSFPHS